MKTQILSLAMLMGVLTLSAQSIYDIKVKDLNGRTCGQSVSETSNSKQGVYCLYM